MIDNATKTVFTRRGTISCSVVVNEPKRDCWLQNHRRIMYHAKANVPSTLFVDGFYLMPFQVKAKRKARDFVCLSSSPSSIDDDR
jgi:hypothetical protein